MGKMTSTIKVEEHNVLHCLPSSTEPRATRTENLVKFGRMVFEIHKQTDRETDIQTSSSQYFASPPTLQWWGTGVVFCLEQGKWFAYGSADATAIPSSLAPVKSRMVYLSGAGLARLYWEKMLNRCNVYLPYSCRMGNSDEGWEKSLL